MARHGGNKIASARTSAASPSDAAVQGPFSGRESPGRETNELRLLLRQDVQECLLRAVSPLSREIQLLRQDVQQWRAQELTAPERAVAGRGEGASCACASGPDGYQLAARMPKSRDSLAESGRSSTMSKETPAESGRSLAESGRQLTTETETEEAIADGNLAPWEFECSDSEDEGPSPRGAEGPERGARRRWVQYSPGQAIRIEKAWMEGASRVRLRRSGQARSPVEIFLVDMLQLDQVSGSSRRVRRSGNVSWWREMQRTSNAIRNQVRTGEPRWETMEKYKLRQEAVVGVSVQTVNHRIRRLDTTNFLEQHKSLKRNPLAHYTVTMISSEVFTLLSMLVTMWQAVWIAIDVDKNENVQLFDKAFWDVFAEYFFFVYFLAELVLRLTVTVPMTECFHNRWFLFDGLCVFGSMVEVIFIPLVNAVFNNVIADWGGFGALRLLRLAKIIRICRVFGASSDAGAFFKGALSGLRAAAFIWAILLAMLFVFGVLLRLNADDNVALAHFPSVPMAMVTLVLRGIFLDDIGTVINDMILNSDMTSLIIFLIFVFLALFNLLNMLMGTFCSVAGDVSTAERDAAQIDYLRGHLASIVDCYIHEEGHIGYKDFQLIIQNADVHRTLTQCGTDMEELKSLEKLVFKQQSEISFDTFFQAIVHLRKGKVATVKDIIHIQDTLVSKLDAIELRLGEAGRGRGGRPS